MPELIDLSIPAYYNNRELSWLSFNKRVLEEAQDERNPLLERFKFLGIFSSNLDEFFMVRVAGLKDQIQAGFTKPENKAGMTPKEQITEIGKITHELVKLQYSTFEELTKLLAGEGVHFIPLADVSDEAMMELEKHFDNVIFPVLTPMAIDAYRPFPLVSNKSLNLAVVLKEKRKLQKRMAIVQIPRGFQRFVEIPNANNQETKQFVYLEELISHFVGKLFPGYRVLSVTQFRITRNADLEIHEEGARDLLKEIEEELKMRKWGATVRLEIRQSFDPNILDYLAEELEVHKKDIYKINGPLDMTFLFPFYKHLAKEKDHLVYETVIPQPARDLAGMIAGEDDIFSVVTRKDILLHHPYESFEPVIELIKCAAEDPEVLAIKQTLYRVSEHSPIIENLKKAAENGKQVLVLVELKARFDENHNIQWAKELEKSGCHVIYGKTYLKTHSKITLIVRKNGDEIQRFVHLGTGNYNEETAKVYTDLSLITADAQIGIDASNYFNYLSGYMEKPVFEQLLMSPMDIRTDFIELIDAEIQYHKKFNNGRIIAKMNSFTEKQLIMKLYEASIAGVKIDLIIRGVCCLRPGIKGVSENINVWSIVGRFLEHSRIYYFHHNGEDKIYLSSADLMTRNIEKRVELAFPVNDHLLKDAIKNILDISLADNVKAREQDEHGNYSYVSRNPEEEEINSQFIFCQMANQVGEDEE